MDTFVEDLLAPGRRLSRGGDGIRSATDSRGDAASYDRLVGSALYNRLVWSASVNSYGAFAATAVASGTGPLLDVGCGSAVFTADVYRAAGRPLVLVDDSRAMLGRARERIGSPTSASLAYVQANLFDLPFRPRQFDTVACHGVLHLFTDLEAVLRALCTQIAPGGTLRVTSLVAETTIGEKWLNMLHRAGETAPPRRAGELEERARGILGDGVHLDREGCMAFLTARL